METYEHQGRSRHLRLFPTQALVLGVVAAAIGWAAWFSRDKPVVEEVELLSGMVLPAAELALVEAAFDRAQLTGHRTEDGRIWVPRPRQSGYMRALVDAEALPREFGSSLRRALEKNSPWQSRAVQEEMLRVAVQDELAHVICSMPGIERASVLYDVRERTGFDGLTAGPQRTASVNIRTQPDAELEAGRVQAIRVLVASSIAGLEAEHVAVTDLRSGRVHAGPLTVADEVPVDPLLARQAAHERHLTTKLRQALAYVKGAVIDVSVTLAAAEPPMPSEPLPAAEDSGPHLPERLQRVADANTPAALEALGDASAPPHEPAPAAAGFPTSAAPTLLGPVAIRASIAVPDSYFETVVQAARERDPTLRHAVIVDQEHERLRTVVRHLLPALPDPTRCDVIVAGYATPRSRPRGGAVPSSAGDTADTARLPGTPSRTVGRIIDATWEAAVRRDVAAVPREAWFAAIALPAAMLVWLVLRGPGGPRDRTERPRRRAGTHPRIDWAAVETSAHAAASTPASHKVAA